MADQEEPTRRYQLRARAKVTEDPNKAAQSKATATKPVRQLTAGTVTTTVKLKPQADDDGQIQTTTITTTATTTTAPIRPTRKPSQSKKNGAAAQPKATSIPAPTRATRSGRVVPTGNTVPNQRKATGGQRVTGKATERASGGDIERDNGHNAAAGGKRVTFQDDKENLLPASEKEADLKQQELAKEEERNNNPLLAQPVRNSSAAGASSSSFAPSPVKGVVRSGNSQAPSKIALPSPLRAAPRRPNSVAAKQLLDDSPDELSCPMSPGVLASPARRPKATHLPPPVKGESANLLASPPRRPVKKEFKLPSVALTFDPPPPAPLQSPAKRNIGLQSPQKKAAPVLGLLASPARRPAMQKSFAQTRQSEDDTLDELSLETYTSGALKQFEPATTPMTATRDTDGDTDMTDADLEDELGETPPSPCPAHFPGKGHEFGQFSPSVRGWELESPGPTPRGVAPLVNGLEGLGLEASRKSLFPKRAGAGSSAALEKSMEVDSGLFAPVRSDIPIDPMLLENEENDVEMATAATVPVDFGSDDDAEGEIDEDLVQAPPHRAPLPSSSQASPQKGRKVTAAPVSNGILAGAVVFVDVYTNDGADASGVLVQLLHTLGAKTVKRWDWNPAKQDGKVGITHVVFKDGSARTLEKVRQSGGVVLCVGAAWIVECDKAQRWVDEGLFSVDLEFVPRGGHRRRKSMEPKQAKQAASPSASTPKPRSPRPFEVAVDGQHQPSPPAAPLPPPSPEEDEDGSDEDASDEDGGAMVLDEDEDLQYTSIAAPLPPQYHSTPPRAPVNRLGFYVNDPNNSGLMEKLMLARRKSMQFAPKVGSPLGKTCMWAN
ncbi:hypothetical protein DFH27DRAFT_539725 [Peziza echinospora]|nr:hypothetical protein DFH27DRAFT_539725 [Peziza echinospora]